MYRIEQDLVLSQEEEEEEEIRIMQIAITSIESNFVVIFSWTALYFSGEFKIVNK